MIRTRWARSSRPPSVRGSTASRPRKPFADGAVDAIITLDVLESGKVLLGLLLATAPARAVTLDVGESSGLLGDTVPAATLNQWGLVWDCVAPEELMARAMDIAGRLATLPPETVLATRRLVDEAPGDNFAHSLEKERELQKHLCDQPVFIESVRNFLDGC